MASQYDSIKTAEELLKEVAVHGLSTKPEDICRAQDIFGCSEVKELIRLANDNGRLNGFDGEPDPRGTYSSGRVGLSKYFYQVAFKIWSWEDANRRESICRGSPSAGSTSSPCGPGAFR